MGKVFIPLWLYVSLFKQAALAWIKDGASSMGAALAFYSAFSLAPLLLPVHHVLVPTSQTRCVMIRFAAYAR